MSASRRIVSCLFAVAVLSAGDAVNLVPATPTTAPNYYCTWRMQGEKKLWRSDHPLRDRTDLPRPVRQRGGMDEYLLFGPQGLFATGFERSRGEMWAVIDDGWDVSYRAQPTPRDRTAFGSLILDAERFPSFPGTPVERLAKLSAKVKSLGWRGLGLWVAAHPVGELGRKYDRAKWEPYYRERLAWSQQAGIALWKVDWGVAGGASEFRAWLTPLARQVAPDVMIEVANCPGAIHIPKRLQEALPQMAYADLYRTYDVMMPVPTTLMRCSILLGVPTPTPPAKGLLNIEDEMYLGASLGCAFGAMAHPQGKPAVEQIVLRTVRWQRLAPPWSVGDGVAASREMLRTLRTLSEAEIAGSMWANLVKLQPIRDAQGRIFQEAPAVLVRGLPLDRVQVTPVGPTPHVVASRHPNGALALAVLPREADRRKKSATAEPAPAAPAGANGGADETPDPVDEAGDGRASVRFAVGAGEAPMGVFGPVVDLTLVLDAPLGARRVWMQDLAADAAHDITAEVRVADATITIPAAVHARIAGVVDPAVVLVLRAP
jgi:hypothetical protein